jgi:HD-like signal output (HDOD) protein
VTSLHDLVTDSHLRELLGGVGILPAPPHIYQEITRITADPEYSLDEVVDTIATDLAVTTEVLRLANSSFFGLTGQVSTLGQAVSLLGLSTIQALAVSGAAFSSSTPPPGLNPSTLTMDGLGIGGLARRIAQAEGWYPASIGNVFLTGLLHQIGLPLLAGAHPEGWTEIRSRAAHTPEVLTDPWLQADAEQEFFGTTSTRVSAYLLGLWGFPDDVLRAVADQPAAPDDPGPTPAGHLLTYARLRHHGRPEAGTGPYLDQARLTRWEAVGADR